MAKKKKLPLKTAYPEWLWDALCITILSGLTIYFVQASWLKWPDPLIDFGRELYLPWRITQGAVLFKDEAHLYGPLSPYLNSLFFRLGGVGLITLVKSNLLIYCAILALLYYLVRVGWERWTALTSCAFFIGLFSFSHLVGIDNYNFLTPYSHEMTHGTLLVLCLILVLRRVVRSLDIASVIAAGLLAGLSLLLKPEIIFAAMAAVAGAIFLIVRQDFRKRPWGRWIRASGLFLAAGFTPVLLATLLFWLRGGYPVSEAWHYANYAWLVVIQGMRESASLLDDPFQQQALGLDHPWQNLGIELAWGGSAVLFAGGLAWCTDFFRRTARIQKVLLLVLLLLAGAAAARVPWINMGYALPGILLCGALIEIARMRTISRTGEADDSSAVRVLLWLSAAAMLARMALNPRVFHYGFVQAALAGIVSVAILMSSIPQFLNLDGVARKWHQALLTVLAASIIAVVASDSMQMYSYHTFPVADGGNQFYSLNENVAPTGLLVEQARQYLEKDARENNVHSLLVMPEGVMLNYLTQLPNSIPYYFFAPFVLAHGRVDDILSRLNAAPPDRIVAISRDMREFGVGRFGDSPEHGKQLIDFINQNYHGIYSYGYNDPLDPERFGFMVFARKH